MKPRTQILLLVALLAGIGATSVLRQMADSGRAAQVPRACCPLTALLDGVTRPTKLDTAANLVTTNRTPSQTGVSASESAITQVIAYYFHGTLRCDTCWLIELLAKAVIEEQFKAALDAQRLVFPPVDYDLPENIHFLADYQLPAPSLVLVRQTNGQSETWKLLGDTWQLVQDPAKLDIYITTEVRLMLGDPAQESASQGR